MTKRLIPNNTLEDIVIPVITEKHLQAYSHIANDNNPIHFDKKIAQQYGFSDCVAHGMLTAGICTSVISPWISANYVVKQLKIDFLSPLIVGDNLHISGEILINTEQFAHIQWIGVNQRGTNIISGEARIERIDCYDE